MNEVKLNELDASILERVGELLSDEKAMTTRTGITLLVEMMSAVYKSQNEIITHVKVQNGRIGKSEKEIEKLKENNILFWIKSNKKASVLIFISIFVFNSMINWSGIRRPVLHALLKHLGIDVPVESIP